MQLNSCTIKGRRSIVEMPNRFRLLPSRHFRRFRRLESGKRRALRFWQKSCRVKSAAFCEVKFKGFYFCLNETWWVSQKISLNSETALHKNHFKSETKCLVCCRRLSLNRWVKSLLSIVFSVNWTIVKKWKWEIFWYFDACQEGSNWSVTCCRFQVHES